MGFQRFEEVVRTQVVRGTCPGCGKKKTRTLRESATVNPFNRTEQEGADGSEPRVLAEVDVAKGRPRTRGEVADRVAAKLKARAEKPFACASCEQSGAAPAMTAE